MSRQAQRSILVVDDDPDFVEYTRLVLETHGFSVFTASNGTEGLDMVNRIHPDLVVLDVMMSTVLDGLSVSQAMADDPALRDIPVVMVSSITDTDQAREFPTDQDIHIDAWLTKPVKPDDLLQKVRALV